MDPVAGFTAAVAALASASWMVWLGAAEKDFYRHWARRRLWVIRLLSMVGHAVTGFLWALGAHKLGWVPFDQPWANGLVYAAAAEGSIRANLAGLQVTSASKIWSITGLFANNVGAGLEDYCKSKIKNHLSRLDDRALAMKVGELLQAVRFMAASEAIVLEAEMNDAAGNTPSRELLLRGGSALALVALWKRDE